MKTFLISLLISISVLGQSNVVEMILENEKIQKDNNRSYEQRSDEEYHKYLYRFKKLNERNVLIEKNNDLLKIQKIDGSAEVPQSERDALVALYNSTNGANWTNNTNWLSSEPVDTWYGITVVSDHVTEIDLYDNNLSGTLPTEIGDLVYLTRLSLWVNQISGSIPSQIGNLIQIEYLDFEDNLLTGSIPSEIGNLTSLNRIYLSENQLSGSIPAEISNLTSLVGLFASDNQLTGNIPSEIGDLISLENLYLFGNQLSGSIPSEIGNLVSLDELFLGSNLLSGNIPPEIGNLLSLTELWLNSNLLSGTIPSEIWNLVSLEYLTLGANQLIGSLSSQVSNLQFLEVLNLYSNQLSGTIPTQIGQLDSLRRLNIRSNQLTGSIPVEVGNIASLESIFLYSNELSGAIPAAIGNLSLLTDLYIYRNNFTDLPNLSALGNLQDLVVNDNELSFEDIVPNISVAIDTFIYAPQDSIGIKKYTNIESGSEFTTSVTVGGVGNNYQWKKDGVDISGANNNSFTISSVSSSDEGSYLCEITNPSAPDLTLYSKPDSLSVGSIIIVFAPSVITGSAADITSTSATLSGQINPNGSTTTCGVEYGTTSSYGTDYFFSDISGSSSITLNAFLTGLSPNTLYYYRFWASNAGGFTTGEGATFITSESSLAADLEWQTLSISTFNWSVGSTISAEINVQNLGSTNAGTHNTQLYLSTDQTITEQDIPLGNPITFSGIDGGSSLSANTTFTVPNVSSGIYRMGAIVDIDDDINESSESNNSHTRNGKIVVGQPISLNLSNVVTFSNPEEKSSYRMIGIPGDVNIPLANVLSGEGGKDWVAYHDNGNTTNYLNSYDGSSTFNFKPGNGFWILANGNLSISQSVNSVELQSLQVSTSTNEIVYPISLHDGWNIISNPFESNVDWNDVQLYNGISESLHSFNGSYFTSSILAPYNGYYFYNVFNLQTLYIPYSINGSKNLEKKIKYSVDEKECIKVLLLDDSLIKAEINIGFDDNAKIGYDKFDKFIPPGDFDSYRLSLYNKNLENNYKHLSQDYRMSTEDQIYDINIEFPLNKNYKLNFEGLENAGNKMVVLVDQFAKFYDLTADNSLQLKSKLNNKLKLLIGSKEFIDKQRDEMLPKVYEVKQNYPNPFNINTKIIYTVPELANVSLKIYDILGKEIITLVNELKPQGIYEFDFSADNLSSGVYFYQIKMNDFADIKKMILLK